MTASRLILRLDRLCVAPPVHSLVIEKKIPQLKEKNMRLVGGLRAPPRCALRTAHHPLLTAASRALAHCAQPTTHCSPLRVEPQPTPFRQVVGERPVLRPWPSAGMVRQGDWELQAAPRPPHSTSQERALRSQLLQSAEELLPARTGQDVDLPRLHLLPAMLQLLMDHVAR